MPLDSPVPNAGTARSANPFFNPAPRDHIDDHDWFRKEELMLAFRNRGMPLEALRYPVTPSSMHYALIHYDIPYIPLDIPDDEYKIKVSGLWNRCIGDTKELQISLSEIKKLPKKTITATLECAGSGRAVRPPPPGRWPSQPWHHSGVSTASWSGCTLSSLFSFLGGLHDSCVDVAFQGLDGGWDKGAFENGFERALRKDVVENLGEDIVVAWEMNGLPLPAIHGFPLRLVVPGWYGMASVKWLHRITALSHPFEGRQHRAYRYRTFIEDAGVPVDYVRVKSLMVPPGVPDWWSGERYVEVFGKGRSHGGGAEAGDGEGAGVEVEGRAWTGAGRRVVKVELGVLRRTPTLNGPMASQAPSYTWHACTLIAPSSPFSWTHWWVTWRPSSPGDYVLVCRATDEAGNVQPMQPQGWDVGGFGNNAVQEVCVTVA